MRTSCAMGSSAVGRRPSSGSVSPARSNPISPLVIVLRCPSTNPLYAERSAVLRRGGDDGCRRSVGELDAAVGFEARRRALANEPPLGCPRRAIPEHRPVPRVETGRDDADRAEPKRKHGVLGVAGVVVDAAVPLEDAEVARAAEPGVERGEQVRWAAGLPRVLQPALPDLGVSAAVDPALRSIPGAEGAVVAEIAVVA